MKSDSEVAEMIWDPTLERMVFNPLNRSSPPLLVTLKRNHEDFEAAKEFFMEKANDKPEVVNGNTIAGRWKEKKLKPLLKIEAVERVDVESYMTTTAPNPRESIEAQWERFKEGYNNE